jgi:chromosome segregation ATPase
MTSAGNLLTALQQLRDAQERATSAEARASVLEEENRAMRQALNDLEQQQRHNPLSARNFEVLESECLALRSDRDASDKLVSELQRQLREMIRRNTMLETESQTRHSALRHQYESHIDSLELELRRVRMLCNSSVANSSGPQARSVRSGVNGTLANAVTLPLQLSSPTSEVKRQSIL